MGQPTYLKAKASGDHSMSVKRRMSENVYGIAPQGPRDTVKAELPEAQFPAVQQSTRCHHVYGQRHRLRNLYVVGIPKPPVDGRWGMNPFKETNGPPKSR